MYKKTLTAFALLISVNFSQASVEDGSICGPKPCRVIEEKTLAPPAFRNGWPSVVVDNQGQPHVLYARAEGGYKGFLSSWKGGDWTTQQLPFPLATGALAVSPDNRLYIMADDGALGATLYKSNSDAQFSSSGTSVPKGQNHMNSHGLVIDALGKVHATFRHNQSIHYGTIENGQWRFKDVGVKYRAATIQLNNANKPTLAFWNGMTPHWYANQKMESVGVRAYTTNYEFQKLHFYLKKPLGQPAQPHLFFGFIEKDHSPWGKHQLFQLLHSQRSQSGKWQIKKVDEVNTKEDRDCHRPSVAGQSCRETYVRSYPVGIVGEGNQIRMLYARNHYKQDLRSKCSTFGCEWRPVKDHSTAGLFVAWFENGVLKKQKVVDMKAFSIASVTLDKEKDLHIAAYVGQDGDTAVHYLKLK